jgi:hypothetical protein
MHKWQSTFTTFAIWVPILSLVISILSLLHYGIDVPYWDDWAPYITGNVGSLDLKYLFQKANDTFMPVGFALESLVIRYMYCNCGILEFFYILTFLCLFFFIKWGVF